MESCRCKKCKEIAMAWQISYSETSSVATYLCLNCGYVEEIVK